MGYLQNLDGDDSMFLHDWMAFEVGVLTDFLIIAFCKEGYPTNLYSGNYYKHLQLNMVSG